MSSVGVQDTIRSLWETGAKIYQGIGLALRASLDAGVNHAKSTTLFKDSTGPGGGNTRKGIHAVVDGFDSGSIVSGGITKYLEEGTAPHLIQAKRANALRFEVGGQTIFRKWVHHPGTKPRPFMEQARDHAEQVLDYGLEFYINEAIEK